MQCGSRSELTHLPLSGRPDLPHRARYVKDDVGESRSACSIDMRGPATLNRALTRAALKAAQAT